MLQYPMSSSDSKYSRHKLWDTGSIHVGGEPLGWLQYHRNSPDKYRQFYTLHYNHMDFCAIKSLCKLFQRRCKMCLPLWDLLMASSALLLASLATMTCRADIEILALLHETVIDLLCCCIQSHSSTPEGMTTLCKAVLVLSCQPRLPFILSPTFKKGNNF